MDTNRTPKNQAECEGMIIYLLNMKTRFFAMRSSLAEILTVSMNISDWYGEQVNDLYRRATLDLEGVNRRLDELRGKNFNWSQVRDRDANRESLKQEAEDGI